MNMYWLFEVQASGGAPGRLMCIVSLVLSATAVSLRHLDGSLS